MSARKVVSAAIHRHIFPRDDTNDPAFAEYADALLAALGVAGYAITKLPEPDSTRYEGEEHEPADRDSWMVDTYEVAVWYPGEVQINYDGSLGEPVDTAIARDLAAALLAAAAAAEENQ